MSVQGLLSSLSVELKKEGTQFVIDCPSCGKLKHCYVDGTIGLWHCKVCGGKGNPYQITKHFKPNIEPKEIFTILEGHGLSDGSIERQPAKPKDISWIKDKLRKPTDDEMGRLCKAKGLSASALAKFNPWCHKTDPVMFLPGYKPGKKKACGFLRVHLDGEMIKTASGEQKYPMIGNWGLLGLKAAEKAGTILFAEGWRDALKAIDAGYTALANTGGTGWQNDWLPLFKGKDVVIVPDADDPGVKSAYERAKMIAPVAKSVKVVTLPYKVTETSGFDLYDYLTGKK